ncbi:MAG: 1-aminocyclopropane-1-carboxylate deaminase/D-cysteine desulfhydrase, partial [Proteobacteria bacterium]|nr:1-aminocyclopropane-1-carboxylate deaminase/D-cysteine desulfhydrase [Pseudomonadota bacterium]
GTLAGLIDGVAKGGWKTKILGVPVLKGGEFLQHDIENLCKYHNNTQWKLYCDYHAGGYAKMDNKTRCFAQKFTNNNGIKLDKIYTAKTFYAAYDLIKKGQIPKGSKIVILHTGGLQGGTV